MAKIIAFSGGCFSGKTTTMEVLREELFCRDYHVIIFDELIRDATKKPIDELRKDSAEYFKVQKQIINAKMEQEGLAFMLAAHKQFTEKTIVLLDRAISDSLFYLENYINTTQLPDELIEEYCDLHKGIVEYAKWAFKSYTLVAEFKPLGRRDNTDTYRPKGIDALKYYEHDAIHIINRSFLSEGKSLYREYDLNTQLAAEVVEDIIKALELK